jgi:hydroxymethylpyrimidine pyrophosphatase-like HAD family hydrolase
MRLIALALDYDGTLTTTGKLSRRVTDAIAAARCAGVRVILVTGRRLAHLASEAELGIFDAIVAENGAVIDFPATGRHVLLGHPPASIFVEDLLRRQVPFIQGECLLEADASTAPDFLAAVRTLEQPLTLTFNRDRLMVLPQGVAKSTGLRRALFELRVSMHNTIAIGDAENDHDLLDASECGVAVGWGSAALRAIADEVIEGSGPDAVAAYIDQLLTQPRLAIGRAGRHRITIGAQHNGEPVTLAIRGRTVIVAGEPGTGKSWLAGLLAEQFILQGYSMVILDPEGDYCALETLPNVTVCGANDPAPPPREILRALRHPGESLVVDLSRLSAHEKHHYIRTVLPILAAERRRTGMPHKVLVDEAHQFLSGHDAESLIDATLGGYISVTYRVSQLDRSICPQDAVIMVTRESVDDEVKALSRLCGVPLDANTLATIDQADAALLPGPDEARGALVRFRVAPRLTSHVRHREKYFDMPVGDAHAFVFDGTGYGPRARSFRDLTTLLASEPAARITGHCERHDFSRWIRDVFRDGALACRIQQLEGSIRDEDARIVADGIIQAIRARYDFNPLPASP